MFEVLLVAILGRPVVSDGGWMIVGRMRTDTYCTTAHDRVSGAVLGSCSPIGGEASVPATDSRLVSEEEKQCGGGTVRIFTYREPGEGVRHLRADIGPDPQGCALEEFLRLHTPPRECTLEVALLASRDSKHAERYDAVVCSEAQRSRAIEYVCDALRGSRHKLLEQTKEQPSRAIAIRDKAGLAGQPLSALVSVYGPPQDVAPRYPDGVTWFYRLVGSDDVLLAIDVGREHVIERARVLCGQDE